MIKTRPFLAFFMALVIATFLMALVIAFPILNDKAQSLPIRAFLSGMGIVSIYAAPIIFVGGLIVGIPMTMLGRRFQLWQNAWKYIGFSVVAGLSYAVFVLFVITGSLNDTGPIFVGALVSGAACGAIWWSFVENKLIAR